MTSNNPALDEVYTLLKQAHVFLVGVPGAEGLQARIEATLRNASKQKQARAVSSDSKGRIWHVLERADKSVSVFYVLPLSSAHMVVWDELDQRGGENGNPESEKTSEAGTPKG